MGRQGLVGEVMPQYLSTDPNAGDESSRYLSTDPNAGDAPPTRTPDRIDAALRSMGVDDAGIAMLDKMDADTKRSVPDQLTAAGGFAAGPWGAGAGAALGSKLTGGSNREALTSGAWNVAVPKAMEGAISAARPVVSGLMRRGAEKAMGAALKPDRGYLEKMAGAKKGGIAAMEREVVDTALTNNINPVTSSGADKLQRLIDETATARTGKINAAANAPVSGSGRAADRAGLKSLALAKRGDAPQGDIASVQSFMDDLRASPSTSEVSQQRVSFRDAPSAPKTGGDGAGSFSRFRQPDVQESHALWQGRPSASHQVGGATTRAGQPRLEAVRGEEVRRLKDLTPKELQRTVESGNERLRGMFSGNTKNSEIQARLRVQRARTKTLDTAAGTADESQAMRRLIDLRNVSNIAQRRSESTNPVSLTDIISLSAGRPGVLLGSVGMKAPALAGIAKLLNRGGKSVATAALVRRLIAGQALAPDEDQ